MAHEKLLMLGRYQEIPYGDDPVELAEWSFTRVHLAPDRRTADAARRAHEAGRALGTYVLMHSP
jgi:hypothetical protein